MGDISVRNCLSGNSFLREVSIGKHYVFAAAQKGLSIKGCHCESLSLPSKGILKTLNGEHFDHPFDDDCRNQHASAIQITSPFSK